MFNHSINHQNTQLKAETKIKLQIVIFLEFWVVFTVSNFPGNSVCKEERNEKINSLLNAKKVQRKRNNAV